MEGTRSDFAISERLGGDRRGRLAAVYIWRKDTYRNIQMASGVAHQVNRVVAAEGVPDCSL